MPFFRYRVEDKGGQTLDGTISATSENEAAFTLSQRGYQVLLIQDIKKQPAPVQAPPTTNNRSTGQIVLAPPTSQPVFRTQAPAVAKPPAKPTQTAIRTKAGSDKALFFLFSQLASMMRSAVSPHAGLSNLSAQTRHSGYKTSLEDMTRNVMEGASMSSVMERYPYLYPPDVVGVVRSGELGGFLPEALSAVAAQKEMSYRLARRLSFFSILVVILLGIFPISLGIIKGSLATIKVQDEAGGSLPPVGTLMEQLGKSLPAMIPPSLLGAAILLAAYVGWHSLPMRTIRHTLALYLPVFAGRAKAEALARFAWTMQKLSVAGIPPNVVFQNAAASVPNVVLRDRLVTEAEAAGDREKLSDVIRRAHVMPEEHEMIVANGEFIGDVPGALATVAAAHDAEFRGKDASAWYKFGCLIYPVIGLLVLYLAYILSTTYYSGLIKTILGE